MYPIKIGTLGNMQAMDVIFESYVDAGIASDANTRNIANGIDLSPGAVVREFSGTIQLHPGNLGLIGTLNALSLLDEPIYLEDQDGVSHKVVWVNGCNPVWTRPDSGIGTVQFKMIKVIE